jgi:tripartite-type tricarboxylate transporter receptor subunit TctC
MKHVYWGGIRIACGALALAMSGHTSALAADPFPTHAIRVVVNTAPGGLTDLTTRLVAQKMSETLKQSVVVENRAGGDGLIGIRAVKSAPADGYTILATSGTIALQPAIKQDAGYDVLKDFTGIGLMGRSPFLLVVPANSPDKTMADFMARAKANPNKVTYASAGVGTAPHLAAAIFFQQAGIQLLHVPYKGNGAAMTDVMSGRVDMILDAYGSSSANIKAGQLRVLGVTSSTRFATLPEVPTFAEVGAPNYSYYTWLCLVAPAGTPKEVVDRLSKALQTAVTSREIEERFREDGLETTNMSPSEFNTYLGHEVTKAQTVTSGLGMKKE